MFAERKLLRRRCEKKRHNQEYANRLQYLKDKINRTMFIPDYVTVVMDHPKHYEKIYRKGIVINGKRYRRFSCSAGQARVSTVVLCCEEIADELERRLNNGRDMNKPMAPSKFNAYFGLAGSSTYEVSEPRFIVVKDYENTVRFMANFVTETDWDKDDTVDQREVEVSMNRTDGMGLISPELAARWADELGLDYVPAQWIIRQSFLKGMVCTFPIHQFCEEVNGGNYIVDTVYKDENGEYIKADLRNVDMIISESQFKLWDSFPSVEQYVQNCHENKLLWGVASYSPKVLKDVLSLNYQFIQTLNLNKEQVKGLCEFFVNWIQGVSFDNWGYMVLFLLGTNISQEQITKLVRSDDQWWIKALIANPECRKDPVVKRRIRELVVNRIHNGCMGEILVPGNFQMMVSDPYAYMEHVCGLPPVGLLGKGQYYSHYWNERGIDEVDSMRSPMTFRSEHVRAQLVCNEQTEKWYQYCYAGFILNWYDESTVRYAGSDFDGDLVASTSNRSMIDGIYAHELPVTYDAPKPKKIAFSPDDLFRSDLFGFGSKIGSITNQGSNAYALLPLLEATYGVDSPEAQICYSRLKQCCVAQSREIDKCKIGQKVKGVPRIWTQYSHINDEDTTDQRQYKELMNHTLIDRRPYFFKYRYAKSRKEWREYKRDRNGTCRVLFGLDIEELEELPNKTPEQQAWLTQYHRFSPLIMSDSPMNLVCRWIEANDFEIQKKVRESEFDWHIYYSDVPDVTEEEYVQIVKCFKRYQQDIANRLTSRLSDSSVSDSTYYDTRIKLLRERMSYICTNPRMVANALLYYFYEDNPSANKGMVWDAYGCYLVEAARLKSLEKVQVPVPDTQGEIYYLGKRYKLTEVDWK